VLYPLSERLGVNLDLGWDYLNTTDIYPTPTTNLWRYRVGLEAGLTGDQGGGFQLKALGAQARVLVMLEQFAGVGYIATVVSRLIGLTIIRQREHH
jgi:hypothetical protein